MAARKARARRTARGSAMLEFALLAPLLVALILWSNYFYELIYARTKGAEMARYIAFERTVRDSVPAITSEAKSRYQDLDGTTKALALPASYRNVLTVSSTTSAVGAKFGGDMAQTASKAGNGVAAALQKVASVIGSAVDKLVGFLGFDTGQGGVKVDVTFTLKNRVVPTRIASLVVPDPGKLDFTLKESFVLHHDTWRAWRPGDSPANTYPTVESRTQERVRKVAYLGITQLGGGALNSIGNVLSTLKLEWPFSDDYINSAVLIRDPLSPGRYGDNYGTRTMPGDLLLAPVYKNEFFAQPAWDVSSQLSHKSGKTSATSTEDNWPMRAYNCRGNFFQGARKSDLPEVFFRTMGAHTAQQYFKFSSDACANP